MYAPPFSPPVVRITHFFTHWLAGLFVAVLLAMAGMAAHAAAPPAGASISNQASASYADGSGVPRTVTSNVVSTTVTQVASLLLTANGNRTATPGSVVYYPHTLTNTGNGLDTFSLTAVSASTPFQMTTVQIFADNGSGLPTGPAITSTGVLAAGAQFKFIVAGTLPNSATALQTNVITVTGASVLTPAQTAVNTDTTTVTTNAVVGLSKAISAASGLADGVTQRTYTLTYTNTGNSTATAIAISDTIPAGMTYVADSALWSVNGVGAINDNTTTGTAPNQLTILAFNGTAFRATLTQLTPGQSGTLSFKVTVNSTTPPGVINNTATTSYDNGGGLPLATGTSNSVPFTVLQAASVTFDGPAVTASANAGSTISFTNVLTNTGNGTDTFNITVGTSNYPLGTTFQLFQSDGNTPLVDTNGDGTVDTGPVAAGGTYNVILKATLPPSATNAGAPFSVTKIARSVFDSTKSATATDQLLAIAVASVDLTNTAALLGLGVTGADAGPEALSQQTNLTNPGTSTVFTLFANNTGPLPDNFNFAASTDSTFASAALPAGWTVNFRASVAGACTTMGANITNSGSVAAAGSVAVCAVVTVPAGFAAGTYDLFFRVLSPTSGVSDRLHDAVTVNAVRSLSITPNGAGQTYPGGSVVYTHTLTNTGNVLEGNFTVPVSTITVLGVNNQAVDGWTSTLHYDLNGDGSLDALDPIITGNLSAVLAAGLAPGASITVFNKVIAPNSAVPGSVNATTITVTTANGSYGTTEPAQTVATDSTTVISGNLQLVKTQVVQTTCSPTDPGASYITGSQTAGPGQCVWYRITATNVGSADATLIVLSDSTPTFTAINTAPTTTVGTIAALPVAPIVGASGSFSVDIGTLTPSQSAVVTFSVRIAN